jgi:hypothetical protein
MSHLAPDEIVGAADGALAGSRVRHLDECEACRRQVEDMAVLLKDAASDRVPEPPAAFWDQLSARVQTAIDAEPAFARWWRRRPGWRMLLPAGAAALIAIGVGLAQLREPAADPRLRSASLTPPAPFAVTPEPRPAEIDDGLARDDWQMVADLVAPLDWETARAAGLGLEPGDAEAAVATLTSDERLELHRLLAVELERSKS